MRGFLYEFHEWLKKISSGDNQKASLAMAVHVIIASSLER